MSLSWLGLFFLSDFSWPQRLPAPVAPRFYVMWMRLIDGQIVKDAIYIGVGWGWGGTSPFLFSFAFAMVLKQYFIKILKGKMLQSRPWVHHQQQAKLRGWPCGRKHCPGNLKGLHRPASLPGATNESQWDLLEFPLAYCTCPDCQGLYISPSPNANEEGWGAETEGISLTAGNPEVLGEGTTARLGQHNANEPSLWEGARVPPVVASLAASIALWQSDKMEC